MNAERADNLKRACPMPILLHRMGLGEFARSSARSPFREDKRPSWGIFQRGGSWGWKDFATGDAGDEIALLARWKGLDERRDFPAILSLYAQLAGQPIQSARPAQASNSTGGKLPDRSGFRVGTPEQLRELAQSRPYGHEGLIWASAGGVLVFGDWHGQRCYGVTDLSGRVLELRRVDGQLFPAVRDCGLSERKSHALRGSQKSWPVGILEARDYPAIALVEGIPDFLEAHHLALWEQAADHLTQQVHCAPVAMLSGSPSIAQDAITHFQGKRVRIFGHADDLGQKGARTWASQLNGVAAEVEMFDFSGLRKSTGDAVKDLYDVRDLDPAEYLRNDDLWKLLP